MAAPFGTPYDFTGLANPLTGTGQNIQFLYSAGTRPINMHPKMTYLTSEDNKIFGFLPETDFSTISPRWMRSVQPAIDPNNAWIDSGDFTFGDPNLPTHVEQVCRIQRASVKMSNASIREMTYAAVASNWTFQQNIAMRQLRREMVWAAYNGGMVNVDENTPRRFRGLFASASNSSNASSGAFTEAAFKDTILKGIYDDNFNPTDVIVHPMTQGLIDAFTANNTKYLMASAKEQINFINVYDSPWGRVNVHVERADYFPAPTVSTVAPDFVYTVGAHGLAYAFDRTQFSVGYFRRTEMFEPSPRGDYREWITQVDWAPMDRAGVGSFFWSNIP